MKAAGPQLTRFLLADSGISAVFPAEPEKSDFAAKAFGTTVPTHTFGSEYCFRVFAVTFFDLPASVPDPSDDDRSKLYTALADQATNQMEAKKTSERDMGFGKEIGLLREFTLPNGFAGSMALVYRKRQVAMMMVAAPKGYRDPDTIDAFYKSLQFTK